MGTNLSQVFVGNVANFESPVADTNTDVFNSLALAELGVWNIAGTPQTTSGTKYWVDSKLFEKTFAITDTAGAGGSVDFANPAWKYNRIQFAQGTGSNLNPIATPIINTANIKRIKFDPYTEFVGTKATIADATFNVASAVDGDEYNFKFIIKSVPTDYLNYYDQEGANIFVDFPLGAFNTTNHKAINVSVVIADVSDADAAANVTNVAAAIAAHPILSKMFTAADVGANIVITAIHPGVVFDLLIENVTRAKDPVACVITGQVLGVGNPWQVLGEEIRCRSRYGNFNRMYLPQNMPTYTNTANKYHKVTIEYATNWPTSTGIAPAGANNQVILYVGGSTALAAGSTNLDEVFNLANVTGAAEYIWF